MTASQNMPEVSTCDPRQCSIHNYVYGVVGDLKESMKLMDKRQQTMLTTLAELSSHTGSLNRIFIRIDSFESQLSTLKVEFERRIQRIDDNYDKRFQRMEQNFANLRTLVIKTVVLCTAIGFVAGIIMQELFKHVIGG